MFEGNAATGPDVERLITAIRQGDCALFLGAGVSIDSGAPNGRDLTGELAAEFLHETDTTYSLGQVAALVEALEGRKGLDEWLIKRLDGLSPSATLLEIPRYRWRAIYTVNFDTLIEDAYRQAPEAAQRLKVFYSDKDPLSSLGPDDVPLYKLHGSIDRAGTVDGHLTVTAEDIFVDGQNRRRLVSRLVDHLSDLTVFYVGFAREDPDFVQVMLQVKAAAGGLVDLRRAYALQPRFTEAEQKRWEQQKVTLLPSPASDFFSTLGSAGPPVVDVRVADEPEYAISKRRPPATASVIADVSRNFLIVDEQLNQAADAELFFRGATPTWGTVAAGMDARRDQADDVLEASLLDQGLDPGGTRLNVIHAEAGTGKSTALRRAGLELVRDWDRVVVELKPYGKLDFLALERLQQELNERLFVLVDNAPRLARELSEFLSAARAARARLTIIATARTNEWREVQNDFPLTATEEIELRPLSRDEIGRVIDALSANQALGLLAGLPREAQVRAFEERARKQLLVALREATEGKSFDDIIVDEYNNIPTEDGQRAYLLVAALHRFGILTRAGLLHRALGIPLADLAEHVFRPTEKVVIASEGREAGDFYYGARHPLIAEILVDRKMTVERIRVEYYETLLSQLDPGYPSDEEAFKLLSRSRNRDFLRDFSEASSRRAMMTELLRVDPTDPYAHQHAAILEMELGNLEAANQHLAKANELHPFDPTIKDTEGTLLRRMAEQADRLTTAESRYAKAEEIFRRNITRQPNTPFGYRNLAETYASWARRLGSDPRGAIYFGLSYAAIEEGLERIPGSEMLLQLQAKLEEEAGNIEGAREAFDAALARETVGIGTRFMAARLEERSGNPQRALALLEAGLATAGESPELHFRIARLLAELEPDRALDTRNHFEAALLGPVRKYLPRLTYAAYLFGQGDFEKARQQFAELENLQVPGAIRHRTHQFAFSGLRDRVSGRIVRVFPTYAWIEFGRGAAQVFWLWRSGSNAQPPQEGGTVTYQIGFTLRGPVAVDVRAE